VGRRPQNLVNFKWG